MTITTPARAAGPRPDDESARQAPAAAPGRPAPSAPRPRKRRSAMQAAAVRRKFSVLPVGGLALVTGMFFHRAGGTSELVPVAATAAVVPALLAFLWSGTGTRAKRPLAVSLLISAVAWLLVVTATLYRDDAIAVVLPGPDLLGRIGSDVLDAPRGILTTVLPTSADAELLVFVSAVVWIASFAGAELALRTESPALPVLPGVLLIGVPVVLTTGAPGGNVRWIAAAVGAAGLILVCRAPGRHSPARLIAVGVPWVAVLVVVAGAAAPRLPGLSDPPDLSDRVEPPPAVQLSAVNPLDRISAWLLHPDQPLFTVSGPAAADRWRLTVLDDYDGASWYPVGGLRPTGGRVPEAPEFDNAKRSVQHITLDGLDGVWLPAADRPAKVEVPDDVKLAVDPVTGALATASRLAPGLRYDVVSQVPVHDPDRVKRLPTVADPAYTTLPQPAAVGDTETPLDVFRRLGTEATTGASFPYQQALRLAEWLRANNRFDPSAVPGHSYRSLRFFLESSKEGTSEQFATAFAVLGRAIGLPTRVVVGFTRGTPLSDGSWRVDSGDVVAWPEVQFAEVGWVPFYPTPGEQKPDGRGAQDLAESDNTVPVPAEQPPAEEARTRAEKDAEIAQQDRPTASGPMPADADDSGTVLWWALLPAALLLLGATQIGLAVAAPRVVRRRRAAGGPDQRLLGAWLQINDRLTEIGLPGGGALTVRETVRFGEDHLPDEVGTRIGPLGDTVNDVAYAGRAPTADEAHQAWEVCAAVERSVKRSPNRPGRRVRWRRGLAPSSIAAMLRGRETKG